MTMPTMTEQSNFPAYNTLHLVPRAGAHPVGAGLLFFSGGNDGMMGLIRVAFESVPRTGSRGKVVLSLFWLGLNSGQGTSWILYEITKSTFLLSVFLLLAKETHDDRKLIMSEDQSIAVVR